MLEVCVDSIESAIAATEGGASRIELCAALSEGGLTPSVGTLLTLKRDLSLKIPIYCMLRPRQGSDFVYSQWEMKAILRDLDLLKDSGADGFVFGALTPSRDLNLEQCVAVVKAAADLPVTFHRAFDVTPKEDMVKTGRLIASLGFRRILTSGLEQTAELGRSNIKKLVESCPDILIMPGCGIVPGNLEIILRSTHCEEFHTSAKKLKSQPNPELAMEHQREPPAYVTDTGIVRELIRISKNVSLSW